MAASDAAIEAARDAERKLWQHYGVSVVERFINVSPIGLRVRVLECGVPSAEPLIFIQGGLGEACGWASLMARLNDFRCITLDRPGGGLSDGVDFLQVDVRQLAVDVLQAVMDTAGVRQAAFVANSMGGWWTFQLAIRAPARVSRMAMLGCPAVILDTSAPLPMRLISLPVIGRGLVRLMVPANPEKARDLPRFLGHPVQVGQQWSELEAEVFYRFGHLPNFRRSWSTLLRRFLRLTGSNPRIRITAADLRGVAQPTLFVWGKSDPFGSPDSARAATALMPNARLEIIGVGHLPWWDEPDECARVVREFVRSGSVVTGAAS
jgi:pimeloyl-ACP methyl ester carboxylesterase